MKKLLLVLVLLTACIVDFTTANKPSQNGKSSAKVVMATDSSKGELNQFKLFKERITGLWKCKMGKDTNYYWKCIADENYIEATGRIIYKGKLLSESHSYIVYEKNIDKCIWTEIVHDSETYVYAWWFTSSTTYEAVPVKDLCNPSAASFQMKFEQITPDSIKQTIKIKNKVVDVFNFHRIKYKAG